jgi:hypothetical protein
VTTSEHLARHRQHRGQSTTCTVDEEALDRVEETLACRIPNEVVGLMATTGRPLDELLSLTTEAEAAGLPKRWLVLARDAERDVYHCIERTTVVGAPCRVALLAAGDANAKRITLSFAEYLMRFLPVPPAQRFPARPRPTPGSVEAGAPALAPARPRLTLTIRPRSSVVGKRVRHRVYGEGSVVTERRDGRHALEVEFPNLGRKVLLSSFVELIDGPGGDRPDARG